MTEKIISKHYSEISKKGWAKLNPEQRKKRASAAGKASWAKLSDKQKAEKIKSLNKGRHKK